MPTLSRSYFIDLERKSRAVSRSATLSTPTNTFDIPRAFPTNAETKKQDRLDRCTTPEEVAQDAWCLNYFNYRTFPTFIEGNSTHMTCRMNALVLTSPMLVLDGDMNGLINIKIVNEFTSAKPDSITLMQWVVYCAYGKYHAPVRHVRLSRFSC